MEPTRGRESFLVLNAGRRYTAGMPRRPKQRLPTPLSSPFVFPSSCHWAVQLCATRQKGGAYKFEKLIVKEPTEFKG